jgi:two-component system sensor histidine kinase ChiS
MLNIEMNITRIPLFLALGFMFKKRLSLSKDFIGFAAVIILTVLLASVIILSTIYSTYLKEQQGSYIEQSERIDRSLSETFDYLGHYAKFLGEKIIEHGNEDPHYIAELFRNKFTAYKEQNNIFSWSLFDWINNDKQVLVSTLHGVINKNVDVSSRSYVEISKQKPWTLHFSAPDIGIISGEWIIPAGLGVQDEHGKFFGTIGSGVNIERLSKKIDKALSNESISYIMLDEDFNYVTSSSQIRLVNPGPGALRDLIAHLKLEIIHKKSDEGTFNKAIHYSNFEFEHFSKSSKYPFYIITGTNNLVASAIFWSNVFPRLSEIGLMGIFCVAVLYYFRKRIIKPITDLSNIAKQIANYQEVGQIPHSDYSELNILADQLQEIQEVRQQLVSAKEATEKLNVELEQKVEARTKELRLALASKTEFLNNMSHEVRTPIQGVTAISQGLVEYWEEFSEEKRYGLASKVAQNAKRLFSLVNNILDLSKFNADKMVMDMQEADLIIAIEEMIEESNTLYIGNKNIRICFNRNNIIQAKVKMDIDRITQVLRNLFTNAIKFTKEGTIQAEIRIVKDANNQKNICFSLRDQGIGLPESEIKDVFDPFIQSSRTKTGAGGTGLGLAICREIIQAHNGFIKAENNEDNIGAKFSFFIPYLSSELVVKPTNTSLLQNKVEYVRPINVLVIDDEDTCLLSMSMLLHGNNYSLVTANNVRSGLDYLYNAKDPIDVILLDLMMPDMNGLNVLYELKTNPRFAHLPVILQSGVSDESEIEKAYYMGVVECIRKPYEKSKIIATIDKVMSANVMLHTTH